MSKYGSQYGEDRILNLFFRGQERGLVVDVGAADGAINSNSWTLLQRPQWKGILIEPEPSQFQELRALYEGREDVRCIQCAIGMKRGKQLLYCERQASTFSEAHRKAYQEVHQLKYDQTVKVPMRRLTGLLSELGVDETIDFLTIDAEGMNYEVWESLDKKRFSPRLVCIEGKGYRMDGYRELCLTRGNTLYLREDLCDPL